MVRTPRRAGRVLLAVALVLASCTGDGESPAELTLSPGAVSPGGTLRVAMGEFTAGALDPTTYISHPLALFRCCLLRTLYSYNGRSAAEGGSVLRPDLAARMPQVSGDALTWTISLKQGLHYAPPFQDREIVAGDIVRALEREANTKVNPPSLDGGESYVFYYSVIRGLDAFWEGEADTISGLETRDNHTLVVHLTEPAGDLPDRFSLPATAPIPEGAANGHSTDYFRYLAASGPYMIQGAEELDPTLPPNEQEPVSGFEPRKALTLVRNPSWSRATDQLRSAYADVIEISMIKETPQTVEQLGRQIDRGLLDLTPIGSPEQLLSRYLEDQTLRDRVRSDMTNTSRFIQMNLALPPFDDVHVRRAVALALDRGKLATFKDEGIAGRTVPMWHIAPNGVEGGLLSEWQPSWSRGVGSSGSLAAARSEMALSAYDHDGDGRCDAPACHAVPMVVEADHRIESEAARELRLIGITLDMKVVPSAAVGRTLGAPGSRVLTLRSWNWATDYPNGSTFFVPFFIGGSITERWSLNLTLLGATPEQLDAWGYRVASVPSADDRIARCVSTTGRAQTRCWAELDLYLMERVVPVIPLGEQRDTYVISERVASYSFSLVDTLPAFDRIALAPGSN